MLDWIDIVNTNNDYFLNYKYKNIDMLPIEAAYHTIQHIHQNYPPPYTLMLSGGVDSQAMLYAWHTSGKSYNTVSAVYNHNLNDNDLDTLRQFIQIHNININFVNFDLISFLQTEHVNYVEKYRCGSPHMTTFMKISEMIKEGTVIMSGNFFNTLAPYANYIDKNNFGLYRYASQTKRPMVPFFFAETQELAFSFKYTPDTDIIDNVDKKMQIENSITENNKQYIKKVELFQKYGFPVIPQSIKTTGFELIKNYYDEHFAHLVTVEDRLSRIGKVQRSYRVFDMLLRNKYELRYQNDKYVFKVKL
jgi:hypothetical protein